MEEYHDDGDTRNTRVHEDDEFPVLDAVGSASKKIALDEIESAAIALVILAFATGNGRVFQSFRLWFEKYPEEFPEYFRVVDLRNGKKMDDGYRAIHLYYQRDNKAYPIEIQLWCEPDHTFNVWSHRYIYKYKEPAIGKMLHDEYLIGKLKNEDDFLLRLKEMED